MAQAASAQKSLDPRVVHSRNALLGAFRELILKGQRFDEIKVADVAARAGVGRSTFYQHFSGMEGLLAGSIATPFSILVDILGTSHDERRLQSLLEHFWANRPLARVVFTGPMQRRCTAVLVGMIERRLRALRRARRGGLILPTRLAAVQLAHALLAPIIAWLTGESRCSSAMLAAALSMSANATLDALVASASGGRG